MSIRTVERAAAFGLAAGLASLIAALALLWAPPGMPAAAGVAEVRATLAKALVLRGEAYAADSRFDTLVEGLVAGVGSGTPEEIAADLDQVRTARMLERALGRRTAETERSIDGALARATASLDVLSTAPTLAGATAREWRAGAAVVALAAALALLACGSALAVRALAVRRAELVSVAERLGIPASHALDGLLGDEVTVYMLTRGRTAHREADAAGAVSAAAAMRDPGPAAAPGPLHRTPAAPAAQASIHASSGSPVEAAHRRSAPSSPPRYLLEVEPLSAGGGE